MSSVLYEFCYHLHKTTRFDGSNHTWELSGSDREIAYAETIDMERANDKAVITSMTIADVCFKPTGSRVFDSIVD